MQLFTQSILLLLMFTTSLTHGEVFTSQQTEDVVNFVETLRQCQDIVGMTMAVVKGNDSWTRGFGKADREANRTVSSSDLFAIGSVTKSFTSALLSVFLNNSYSWETPVKDILGEDFEFVNDELTQNVTLRDMLVHRTGLENVYLPLNVGSNVTRAEWARRIRYLPTKRPFRDEFDYNDWMYGLLGHVTEVMGGGASWEDLLQSRLLQPLSMSSTKVMGKTVTVEADNFANPYVRLGDEIVRSDSALYSINPAEAAGAIASSADDMVKWMLMHINKGWSEAGGHVLNSTRMREITSAQTNLSAGFRAKYKLKNPPYPVNFSTDGYSYGWMTASYRGYPVTWHSGIIFAYTSFLAFIPHLNVGFFLANNGPIGGKINRLFFYYVADLLLQEEPWLNVSNVCQFPKPWVNKSSASHQASTVYNESEFHQPERYASHYGHQLYGDVNVMRDGSLGLKAQYGHLEGRLFRGEENHVAMWEIQGKLAYWFRKGNKKSYLQLNFSRPSRENSFQDMVLSWPAAREMMEFVREGAPGTSS